MRAQPTTYEIGFKAYYGETSDYCTEYINASSEREALRKFAILKKMGKVTLNNPDSWHWNEGVWYCAFKFVKQVNLATCPMCKGIGKIKIDVINGND